ncbi:DUF4198 domain-containing protein [Aliamphritea spongicola]|nr:DUF4198 domain-containing protein [Aliamphritea spongicola]
MTAGKIRTLAIAASTLYVSLAGQVAQAHDYWLLPNEYVASSDTAKWITVDVTASNTIFVADKGFGLEDLTISAPQGESERLAHYFKGKRKSVFDLKLAEEGTYRLRLQDTRFLTFYRMPGSDRMHRMEADKLQRDVLLPEGAENVETLEIQGKSTAYVTRRAPSSENIKLQNEGLELDFEVHPNDVVSGEAFNFKVLLDGKPVADEMLLEIIPDGTLYRDQRGEIQLQPDSTGAVSFTPLRRAAIC